MYRTQENKAKDFQEFLRWHDLTGIQELSHKTDEDGKVWGWYLGINIPDDINDGLFVFVENDALIGDFEDVFDTKNNSMKVLLPENYSVKDLYEDITNAKDEAYSIINEWNERHPHKAPVFNRYNGDVYFDETDVEPLYAEIREVMRTTFEAIQGYRTKLIKELVSHA